MRDEILDLIKKSCATVFGVDEAALSESTTFESLDAKSANIVQITTALEDEFDAEVPFMAFRRSKTLGEAADYMVDLLGY